MTSDERIEIAESLRGPFDVCKYMGHTCISGTLFGMQVCAMNERSLRDGMRRLADLIDPTCEVDSIEPIECGEFNQTIGYVFNLTCGHSVMMPYMDMTPAYCTECGARVVDDGD